MAPETRQRILDAALRCFAEKGYAATTMADIEAAAGFVPRTGGTYRHFRSKLAILEAAVDDQLTRSEESLSSPPTSFEGAARQGLAQLDHQRDLIRVLFRDLDRFPDLLARVVERLIRSPYRVVAERNTAVTPDVDAEALAAVMIGSLVNYKVIEAMFGERPAGVSEERFVAAWAQLYAMALEVAP